MEDTEKDNNDFNSIKVSGLVLVKDEEKYIARCIQSIYDLVDEIIVFDTGSTDNTIPIIRSFGQKVILKEVNWDEDFALARNQMLDIATGDIIFQIDADEYIPEYYLKNKIREEFYSLLKVENNIAVGCPVIENDHESSINHIARVFLKKQGLYYFGNVHEELRHKDNRKIVKTYLDILIKHDGYLSENMIKKNKTDRNLALLELVLKKEPDNPRWNYFMAREMFYNKIDANEIKTYLKVAKEYTREKDELYERLLVLEGLIYKDCCDVNGLDLVCERLKKNCPDNIDYVYFRICLLQEEINSIYSKIDELKLVYSRMEEKSSYIHSGGNHIWELIFWRYWSDQEYQEALKILNTLVNKNEISSKMNILLNRIQSKLL